jgi:probable selenium-dependent hydroxylase accessory protein YqeC
MSQGSLWEMTGQAQIITLIGAGGKTTCLRSLTKEIHTAGHRVIATTTTKVFPDQEFKAWKQPDPPRLEETEAVFWYIKAEKESGKWLGPSSQVVDEAIQKDIHEKRFKVLRFEEQEHSEVLLESLKRYWVIEGDGARRLHLKCWASHEPQIPLRSNCAILVIDRNLWGKVLQAEQVHRWELCQELIGQVWNEESFWRYILKSPVFYPQYAHMSWVVLLNSSDKIYNKLNSLDTYYSGDILGAALKKLYVQGLKMPLEIVESENKPLHLSLAEGDAKEGKLQWFDLW